MTAFTTSHELAKALEAAMPMPKNMRGFTLRCYVDEAVTLTVESYPGIEVGSFVAVMAEYDLNIRQAPIVPEPMTDGFDAWMRDRTDKAHAEYMARHAAGGFDYQKRVA